VGITGSSGKTTTKEIAAAMIGSEKKVVINPGNLNSDTGLPLAVFGVRPWHEVGIFEMGMNRRGEIAELTRVLKPRIALITNIGSAHIGILGTREAIAQEKKMIFSELSGAELALIPEDDAYAAFLAEGVRGQCRFYGNRSISELGGTRSLGLGGTEIIWEGVPVSFALPGKHNIKDALAAAAIAREVPVSSAGIRAGLASVRPLFGRSEIIRGPVTVIRDCYNANPESMEEALSFCDDLDWPGRRIYVTGSMLELGARSAEAHRDLGRLLARSRADMVFLFGAEMEAAIPVLEQGGARGVRFFHTNDIDELARRLATCARSGDLVLLKGSRGCALEGLSDVFTAAPIGAKTAAAAPAVFSAAAV
jgi:UDP-N-acetylmuramoyl-tripeptide--D-alanyl-D-alanine ligase